MVTSIGSTPTRRRANGGTRRRVAIVTAVMAIQALLLAGCAQATPVTPVAPSTSATSVGTASAAPGLQATPAATSTPVTQFDGVWATRQLTIDQLRSAVQAHGMDPAHFNEVVGPNPGFSDHVVFEVQIRRGRWVEYEVDDGVPAGVGWEGDYTAVGTNTFKAKADNVPCEITYDLTQNAGELAIDIKHEDCTDPDDVLIQAAIYESGPFHRVEAADPIIPTPTPSAPAPSPLPSLAPPSTSKDRLTTHEKGTVKGASLGYLDYLPADYDDRALSPLLVFLHGSGESGDGTAVQLRKLTGSAIPYLIDTDRWPDDRPFVVLMPQHDDVPGSPCFTPAEIHSFLGFAIAHYDVDPARVYLTGLSCGAIGMWNYLGAHTSEVLAAAVPIAGYGIGAFDQRGCSLGTLPIWAFHGADDGNVVLRGDVYPIESLQACTDPKAVDARLTVYPNRAHDVWTETYDLSSGYDIYGWMLSHARQP